MIIDHTSPYYQRPKHAGRHNGAYYYSVEIVENIIPKISTDRSWLTINAVDAPVPNGAIVFIHNNKYPMIYDWLKNKKDLILVCGIPETCEKIKHLGTPIYLPLSIDVEYVKQFRAKKTRDVCYAGRASKKMNIPEGTDLIQGVSRQELLERMARYRSVYAVGRTALEAKVLQCKILPYDDRFPDVKRWQVIDNSEAADMLQLELNKIDNG